jgi:hypothetical protein
MHLPVRLLTSLRKSLEEILPVHVVQVDVLAPIAPAHYVADGAGIFDAQLSRHGATSNRIIDVWSREMGKIEA